MIVWHSAAVIGFTETYETQDINIAATWTVQNFWIVRMEQ